MHILFLTDNFPPEGNAPASRTYDHAIRWVNAGCKVTVITCAPNFPHGRVYKGYKNKLLSREWIDGIRVWRVGTFMSSNQGFILRTLDFLSFMVAAAFWGLFVPKPDVVVGTSPQFFTAIAAYWLALVKRAKFVFELRDLWPATVTAVGVMRRNVAILLLEKIEIFLYRRADLIISVTQSFVDELIGRGIDRKKLVIVRNGADLSTYFPKDTALARSQLASELAGKFVFGYVGTHGRCHALEHLLDAAASITDVDVTILMAGGGEDKERLDRMIEEQGLVNIVSLPMQPKELMPDIWAMCDVAIVHLKDDPVFSTVIPSKIFEALAMGKPLIYSGPVGEASQLIADTGCGFICPPESGAELARGMVGFKSIVSDCPTVEGRCVDAAKKFDRDTLALSMLNAMEEVLP